MTEVFTIEPAGARAFYVLGALAVLLLGLLLLFGFTAYSARATSYELSSGGLRISGTLYGRTLPWNFLRADEASAVDLKAAPDLQPTLRTNGIGLPGYSAGWFRLRRSGRGLLFVTDPSRVVAIPTTEGYTLLLSVRDPDRFLAALQHQARSGTR